MANVAVLNYEAFASHSITVRVTDGGTPGLTYDKAFTVTVNDVNESPTDILLSNNTVNYFFGPNTSTAAGMSNNAVLMDFNTSSQNLGVQVVVRDLDGDGNAEIEALTTQDTSMLLSAYDYNGTLAPTTLMSKTYARLNGASAPVRIG